MRALLFFSCIIFLFSCKENEDNPVPLKTKGKIVGYISFVSQYLYGEGFDQDKNATYILVGKNFNKEISTNTASYAFPDVPFGAYTLFITKTGYETIQFSFDFKYEDGQYIINNEDYLSEKRSSHYVIEIDHIKIREISTLQPNQLSVFAQANPFPETYLYLKKDFGLINKKLPIVRFFVNSGGSVSPSNYLLSFSDIYDYDSPYSNFYMTSLLKYGLKAGDLISIVAYGDSDFKFYENSSNTKFPTLSQNSSNIVTHVIQ